MTKEELRKEIQQYIKENLTVEVFSSYDDNYVKVSLFLEGKLISYDNDSVMVRIDDD
jgi:hypothetical protein